MPGITGFTKNDFWRLKLGVIFTLKERKKEKKGKKQGISNKGRKKDILEKLFCFSVSHSLQALENFQICRENKGKRSFCALVLIL